MNQGTPIQIKGFCGNGTYGRPNGFLTACTMRADFFCTGYVRLMDSIWTQSIVVKYDTYSSAKKAAPLAINTQKIEVEANAKM